jgi:death-on-curing protein
MPQQRFGDAYLHDDLFAMAAAYAFHISQNQPFVDGNKRTALAACLDFLDMNGVISIDDEGRLYEAMVGLATHAVDKTAFAEVLRSLPRG